MPAVKMDIHANLPPEVVKKMNYEASKDGITRTELIVKMVKSMGVQPKPLYNYGPLKKKEEEIRLLKQKITSLQSKLKNQPEPNLKTLQELHDALSQNNKMAEDIEEYKVIANDMKNVARFLHHMDGVSFRKTDENYREYDGFPAYFVEWYKEYGTLVR